jgi:hypothetical protein
MAKAEQWLVAELDSGEPVLARGAGGEARRGIPKSLGSPWSDFFIVTPRRLLWVPRTKRRYRAVLEFDAVTSWTDGTQYHHYCLVLTHEPIERDAWAPAHRFLWFEWGDTEERKQQSRTILKFSRRETKVAGAIRGELQRRGIAATEPLPFEEVPRSERFSDSPFIARRWWRRRSPR